MPQILPDDLDLDVRWTLSRMVPQPVATLAQPVRLTGAASSVDRTYIYCTEGKDEQPLPPYVERAHRTRPGGTAS